MSKEDVCDFCPAMLSGFELAVLNELTDGEVVYPAWQMAADLGVTVLRLRQAIGRLRLLGLAQSGSLVNDDGQLCGRGNWLTGIGERLQDAARSSNLEEQELSRAWILELLRRDPESAKAKRWAWGYAYRGFAL